MNITFDEALNEYLNYIKIKTKPQSLRSIKSRINNFIRPYFNNYNIYEFSKKDYLNFQQLIEKQNFKFRYKRAIHGTYVSFLNFCIVYYNLNENVASKVGNFKNYENKRKYEVWDYKTFKKFIKKVDNNVYKIFYEFLFFTGCRTGEAQALTWNNINKNFVSIEHTISKEFINGKRAITTPKTKGSIRKIKIDFKLKIELYFLKKFYKKNISDFNNDMFVFGANKPLSPTTIERKKNEYCKKANVKQIRIHDFRHSHATILLNKGIPINLISERLGHTDIAMTLNTYSHTTSEQEKRVIKTLNVLRLI